MKACLISALLVLVAALPAGARSGPRGGSGIPRASADPLFEPILRGIESRMPAYEAVENTDIRVPAPTIQLGLSTKRYRCWKLRLTGGNGKQARQLLKRLKSVQDALTNLRAELSKNVVLHTTSSRPDPAVRRLILKQRSELEGLVQRYDSLIEIGTRNKIIDTTQETLFGASRSVTPRLRDDDYTMVHDESVPGCKGGGNRERPSGV